MKIMVISPKNKTLYNFRGDLIKKMISKGHEVIAIGPNKDHIEDVLALGVKFIEVPFNKDNISALGDIKYYKELKKVMKEEKPDLVFSYTIKPVIYSSMAAHSVGVKKIYPMITGLGRVYASTGMKARAVRLITGLLYKRALKPTNTVIFQNTDDLKRLVNLKYIAKEKAVRVNGSGVNMEKFKNNELPENHVFLMIARIIKEKGIFEFANAARIVKKKYPNARFILVGGFDNSLGAIAPEDINPYIEDGSIEFPGETKDVIPYLKESSVFVLPTYYREGLPRTILEAMAMARPVITTDWPGCRDAVINEKNGFLIQPKDSVNLAEKMKILIEYPIKVKEMSNESLRICKEFYEVNKVNNHMLDIMDIK
ncbi:Glycosyltransferase involved in cell wall bisynthesis [Halobacillus alkaliphilus]|uniref:Glycosyltransferase involved in cell wall bisynthesis n=1 Tax=Halobacillus alkaliphilus TaxID=396056 RepID=A0A1I2JV80_9BACI|nr:glycosyltransferase family 4 protein [Halobacillus alkaliphilus]SFF58725.1 Glycosyltransferase involved in cell wall bisynthesis [Halobacillus alkaliphilus]